MTQLITALNKALKEADLTRFKPMLISEDIGVLAGVTPNSKTFNSVLLNTLDVHEALVGAVLGTRPFVSGKNGAREIPPMLRTELDGTEYVFWINTLEGMHMAAIRSVPFVSVGLESILWTAEGGDVADYIDALRKLATVDYSAFISQSLSSLGNLMNSASFDPVKIGVAVWLTLQVRNYKNGTQLTLKEFVALLDGPEPEDQDMAILIGAANDARNGKGIAAPFDEEGNPSKEIINLASFGNAIRKLVEEYTTNHASLDLKISEEDVIAAATGAENAAIKLAIAFNPDLVAIKKAFDAIPAQ